MRPLPRLASSLSVLLCLVWLGVPRVGFAAGDVPRAGSPRLALESTREPERPRASRGLRLLTEVGTGLLTSVGTGVSLGLLGYGLCRVTQWGYESSVLGCGGTAALGAAMGVIVGYPLGVWWGGELQGGHGSLLSSMLGGAVGLLAGSAVAALAYGSGNEPWDVVPWVALPVLFVTGAHLGYELFQRAPASGASRPGLQPMLSFSSRGALLGLGGRF